jgi:Domain of unknown function (DUF4338)
MAFDPMATLREWKQKVARLQERWRGARQENEQLRKEIEQLRRREKQLEQEREQLHQERERLRREQERLREENEKLKRQLEEAQRAAKRQAAPFSRDTRNPNPKTPGRKPGLAYGQRYRKPIPENFDEVIAVPAPKHCCCGGELEVERIESQLAGSSSGANAFLIEGKDLTSAGVLACVCRVRIGKQRTDAGSTMTLSFPLPSARKNPRPVSPRLRFCGRLFSGEELGLMRELAGDYAGLGVTEMARTVCELLDWKRANGRLKHQECRQLLEHLRDQGWLKLPRLRNSGPRGPRQIQLSEASAPQARVESSAGEFEPLELRLVESRAESQLWTELIERYHYLGHRVPVGANLRYLVRSGQRGAGVLACLLWSSPAWKMAARDEWIGWNSEQRARNLQLVVNNGRFLVLPWVRVKGLASKILAQSARQLPIDWEHRYGNRPWLLETLVDAQRFHGTCYRAANWIHVGQTSGRGRMDREHKTHGQAVKDIYLYPLARNTRQRLCMG